MKMLIDIPESYYNLNDIQNGSIACGQVLKAVKNGKPYEEKAQGDLISREALKKHKFPINIADGVEIKEIEVVPVACIDNAPTINPCENCDLYFKAMMKEEMRKARFRIQFGFIRKHAVSDIRILAVDLIAGF